MTDTHDTIALAQHIAQHHAQLQIGQPLSAAEAALPADAHLPQAQAAALQGARMLGFIEADAQCVAKAWLHQTQRLGQFDPLQWPDQALDFDMPAWPRQNAFAPCPRALGLYAVLPNAEWVARMAQAGVPTLQLRFKSDQPAEVASEVRAAVKAVEGTGALLFINDHWQHAIDAGAYGIHLGQEDLDSADLSAIQKAGLRLGLSTHGYAEMMRADALSPSYIAMGAVFPTTLKNMPTAPQGLGRLGAYAKLMQGHSLVAIGGIDEARFADVRRTGVGSIAVVRALVAAADPEATARELMQLLSPP
jgi:thiamine-phosphate pyrophosphorylase